MPAYSHQWDKRVSMIFNTLSKHRWNIFSVLIGVLLIIKFSSPLFRFSVPLGYDPGIYRYLMLQYGAIESLHDIASMPGWMKQHSLGLFLFTTPLLKLGVPVDWFMGWIWSAFAVFLAITFAVISAKEWGKKTGIAVLIILLLSEAYYTGFAFMYWKSYVAMLFCTLSFYFFSRNTILAVLFGFLTILTHNQTGLLFGLTLLAWAFLHVVDIVRHPKEHTKKELLRILLAGACILIVGLIVYKPIWGSAVMRPIHLLMKGWSAPSGTFPISLSYLTRNGGLLFLGTVGFISSLKRREWSLWHLVVLISLVIVCSGLFFHKRFVIQLGFFSTPFIAIAIVKLWNKYNDIALRSGIFLFLCIQAIVSLQVLFSHEPRIDAKLFSEIQELESILPEDAMVITMDDRTAIMLRGWLPDHKIGGQGIFDLKWTYDQWKEFLLGQNGEREELLGKLQRRHKGPIYIFTSPQFYQYYKEYSIVFVKDRCFQETRHPHLLKVVCEPQSKV